MNDVVGRYKWVGTRPIRPDGVPKVTGKSLSAAKRAITHGACTVGKVKRVFSAKVKKGDVISQRPKAGKKLAYHAKVSLVVSKG